MRRLLVIEDGDEYREFARLFLAREFAVHAAKSAGEALALLRQAGADALLVDLRFERSAEAELVGDVAATAARLFAGDREQALRYLRDQQGTLILAELRAAGFSQPAVFVHDFPPRRLANLRRLYGDVRAVPSFDAALLGRALLAPAPPDQGTPPP
jgi:CheY-like chemotaxis protein